MESRVKKFDFRQYWHWIAGFLAFLWIVIRSGANPRRLTYPCQRAAVPFAANWLLAIVAFVGGSVFLKKFARLSAAPILIAGAIWLTGALPELSKSSVNDIMSLPVWEVEDPISTVFAMDSLPPTSGSLAPGDSTVPDEYLVDPAIDTLLAMMAYRDIFLHRTDSQPDGIVGPDNIVIIKGNFQWTGRNTTSADRIKGLIWQILQHPDGFTGEILVCDNTQNIGTGINDDDNNSEDREQSIPDVVNTFYDKGYPVYYLDWSFVWDAVCSEYSDGDYRDGFIYETDTKISYPKFRSPSDNFYISMRYGIWDSESAEYDSSRLCIVDFPVLKAHVMAGATIGVKNWIGTLTTAYAGERYGGWNQMHYTYFWGSYALVARVMEVTFPKLTIVDAAWTSTYNALDTFWVEETKMLAASTDPVAVSWYTAKFMLTPVARYPTTTDPDRPNGTYNISLSRWTAYLRNIAGLPCTMDSSEISVYDRGLMTDIDDGINGLPEAFTLFQNYPNPFNSATTIRYNLPEESEVTISVYDILGREMDKIICGNQPPGHHHTIWHAAENSSGIYIYRIQADAHRETGRMILLK